MSERDSVAVAVAAAAFALMGFLVFEITLQDREPMKPEACVRHFIYDKYTDIECVAMPENGGYNRYSWTCRGVVAR